MHKGADNFAVPLATKLPSETAIASSDNRQARATSARPLCALIGGWLCLQRKSAQRSAFFPVRSAVCATVLVTVGILCQARASTADAKEVIAKDDDHYIEWIIPETPPLPPVLKDGKWLTWEEVFGPLPKPKPAAVKRPRSPKPPGLPTRAPGGWQRSASLLRSCSPTASSHPRPRRCSPRRKRQPSSG